MVREINLRCGWFQSSSAARWSEWHIIIYFGNLFVGLLYCIPYARFSLPLNLPENILVYVLQLIKRVEIFISFYCKKTRYAFVTLSPADVLPLHLHPGCLFPVIEVFPFLIPYIINNLQSHEKESEHMQKARAAIPHINLFGWQDAFCQPDNTSYNSPNAYTVFNLKAYSLIYMATRNSPAHACW